MLRVPSWLRIPATAKLFVALSRSSSPIHYRTHRASLERRRRTETCSRIKFSFNFRQLSFARRNDLANSDLDFNLPQHSSNELAGPINFNDRRNRSKNLGYFPLPCNYYFDVKIHFSGYNVTSMLLTVCNLSFSDLKTPYKLASRFFRNDLIAKRILAWLSRRYRELEFYRLMAGDPTVINVNYQSRKIGWCDDTAMDLTLDPIV